MIKTYPPIWCREEDCSKCDLELCNKKSLALILPYRDEDTPFEKKGFIEITSYSIYFGFCPRLAKFFLEFPSYTPIPVIYSNFSNFEKTYPTSQSIQRILLDILAISDPAELTNDVFKYRGLFFIKQTKMKKYGLQTNDGQIEYLFTEDEINEMDVKILELKDRINQGIESFPKTNFKERCNICFLKNSC